MMNRRAFLATSCISAAAAKLGVFDFASSLFAAESKPSRKPVIRTVFVHPKVDKYWLGWPGAAYDIKQHQQQYMAILRDAAGKLDVNLDSIDEPLCDAETVSAFLEKLEKTSVDGLIITIMDLNYSWDHVNNIAQKRGNIPTIVFSPMGSSFTGHLQTVRNIDGVLLAATQDMDWLATGLKLLKTVSQMKNSRICIVKGDTTEDKPLEIIGTTLHYVPHARFIDTVKKSDTTEEMRSIADYYIREAKMIVEPSKDDILNAAKNYIVARQIMNEEQCDGFSMECLGPAAVPREFQAERRGQCRCM
jgi:hypothetical protein